MSTRTLRTGDWWAELSAAGLPLAVGRGDEGLVTAPGGTAVAPCIEIGGRQFQLDAPVNTGLDGDRASSDFDLEDAGLRIQITSRLLLLPAGGAAVETTLRLQPQRAVTENLAVRMPAALVLGGPPTLFAPLRNGVGFMHTPGQPLAHPHNMIYDQIADFAWHLAGNLRSYMGAVTRALGLPLVSESRPDGDWRLTWCSDPYFSTGFRLRGAQREIHWQHPGGIAWRQPEERRLYACVHGGDVTAAIDSFYASALRDIPPGPAWLHEIALAHYDYLADDGEGWFRDLDALAAHIDPEQRHRVCVCLHGWYDLIGRYAMDESGRRIESAWTAWLLRDGALTPVPMSRERVSAMLRHARNLGFRTTLYFGDGPQADSAWAAEQFPAEAVLRGGGGDEFFPRRSVILNPLHPAVRQWFADYTRALLEAWGEDLDGLVWDETYYITAGELGPAACPGHADRAWMQLMQEVARIAHDHRPDLAVLGSDCLGTAHGLDTAQAVAYSLVVDGGWQDSECEPNAWAYGIFPNWRNVLWSCNWVPQLLRDFNAYGVRAFGAPVATSNGHLENRGPADLSKAEFDQVLSLLNANAARSRAPFWLDEDDPRVPRRRGPSEPTIPDQT